MVERALPDKNTLQKWWDEGLSYIAMAERHNKETGENRTRQAFYQACKRYGIWEPQNYDHSSVLPPDLRTEHSVLYDTNMIRRWNARRQGKVFNAREDQKINGWLANLNDAKCVLLYRRDTQEGWHPVPRKPSDEKDFPLRRDWIK